jgi:hypothetical protein
MREAQESTIGGRLFSVTPLPAMRALRLWPVVARGFMTDESPLTKLTSDEIEALARGLLALARVDGKELLPVIDVELQGDMPSLMELLSFAVRVNYSGFSDGSAGHGQPAGSGSGA